MAGSGTPGRAVPGSPVADIEEDPEVKSLGAFFYSPYKGETMTATEMVKYAYDQIDQARTELERHR